MGRLRLRAITACTVLAISGWAEAAEITRVASSGDPGNPFDLDLSVRWERTQERATITREQVNATTGEIEDVTALRYVDTRNTLVPRVAIGLYQDLELHFELPYVLGADDAWRYGLVNGVPVTDSTPGSIGQNPITPDGTPCAIQPCPLFPVGQSSGVYHGGRAGDLQAGITWGIFSDRRDDTKPFWLVGLDVTFPTATLYDPAAGRPLVAGAQWQSPYSSPARTGPLGEKVWKYDLYTALSRRMGSIDPYFKAHVTAYLPSSSTYSNCDHADALSGIQMGSWAAANCKDPRWKDDAGARLPYVAGLTFGTEVVPYEDAAEGQKVAFDVRIVADYTSSARWYNELTDATGKLLSTDPYVRVGGLLGMYLHASPYVSLRASVGLSTETSHYLTGESLGKTRGEIPSGALDGSAPNPALNPNYDWRYDMPGRRFRLTDVTNFSVAIAGVLQF